MTTDHPMGPGPDAAAAGNARQPTINDGATLCDRTTATPFRLAVGDDYEAARALAVTAATDQLPDRQPTTMSTWFQRPGSVRPVSGGLQRTE